MKIEYRVNAATYTISATPTTSYTANFVFSELEPPTSVTIPVNELTVGVPFVYSLAGKWYAVVKRADARLDFYRIPEEPVLRRLWRRFRR